ncbi:kanamycin nucleotidyltransferase C-terminal domain-containing protein [Alkalihalophilus marmarensis]|uniref:kanamycin nucleotidyltransferase C-terminal domain-containing protein n=1 Tax=Alkalihalophilus marmarensis TaxID=521377 RepID=UPI002E21B28E|nr:kanamycin nucleotidyltransferase C-terminal domain-containing protein [Alkalihalophilus marmarensis]MED1603334.1 kanamycin nucleotidyltransferase C-terminal domain-containing protein [Alkalihalophilus marmarensis]
MINWQPKTFSAEDRLKMTDNILDHFKTKYKKDLLSLAIEGSTAKGMNTPFSDLELRVVLNNYENGWFPFFFQGMYIGISMSSREKMLSEASKIDYEWPVKSDTLFTSKIVYDPTELYKELRNIAEKTEGETNFKLLLTEAIADMYEHVYKVFPLTEGDEMAMTNEARQIAYWATLCVGLSNKHRYVSSRTMYKESFHLNDLPDGYEEHMHELLTLETTASKIKQSTACLWTSFEKWAKEDGITLNKHDLTFL